MKQCTAAVIVLLVLLGIPVRGVPGDSGILNQGIHWYAYKEGMTLGEEQQKDVYLYFYATWCRYCREMEQTTFRNPEVVSRLNAHFIPIKVNADADRQLSARYNVRGLPSSWFLSGKGEPLGNRPGYIPPDLMLKIFKAVRTMHPD